MKITKDNVKEVINYIKSGGSVFVKGRDIANVWQFSLKDDQRAECRNVDTGYVCHYEIKSLDHDAMWEYELVSVSGIPVDMSHYVGQSTKHKHYDLIMKWAADPANVKIQWLSMDIWVDAENPNWCANIEYRIKPKEPVIYRQVIYTRDDADAHKLSLDKYSNFEDFEYQTSGTATIIGWYDATAEERFE